MRTAMVTLALTGCILWDRGGQSGTESGPDCQEVGRDTVDDPTRAVGEVGFAVQPVLDAVLGDWSFQADGEPLVLALADPGVPWAVAFEPSDDRPDVCADSYEVSVAIAVEGPVDTSGVSDLIVSAADEATLDARFPDDGSSGLEGWDQVELSLVADWSPSAGWHGTLAWLASDDSGTTERTEIVRF